MSLKASPVMVHSLSKRLKSSSVRFSLVEGQSWSFRLKMKTFTFGSILWKDKGQQVNWNSRSFDNRDRYFKMGSYEYSIRFWKLPLATPVNTGSWLQALQEKANFSIPSPVTSTKQAGSSDFISGFQDTAWNRELCQDQERGSAPWPGAVFLQEA